METEKVEEVRRPGHGGKSYRLSEDGARIKCLRCGLISHNPNDVAEKYCGHCHAFHDETMRVCDHPDCDMVLVLIMGTMLPRFCSQHDDR